MSTKIFCDGCDADITNNCTDARKGLCVSTSTSNGTVVLGQFEIGPFDLCGGCIQRFKQDVNPRKWPREKHVERPTFGASGVSY